MAKLRTGLAVVMAILAMVWLAPSLQVPTVHASTFSLSFTGGLTVSPVPLNAGLATARFTHNGQSTFIIRLRSQTNQPEAEFVNAIGAANGQSTDDISATGNYILDVQADGDWSITIEQADPTATPTSTGTPTRTATPTQTPTATRPACDPSYPDFCIPPRPPDLDCDSPVIAGRTNFRALPPDPHNFDNDSDGLGCDSSAVATSTPTPNPVLSCAPRPPVNVRVTSGGLGGLNVTVTVTGANNYVSELRFGTTANARITAPTWGGSGNFTVPLPAHPTSVSFAVQRNQGGLPVQVPFVVVDGCGQWPTFVGAGASVR